MPDHPEPRYTEEQIREGLLSDEVVKAVAELYRPAGTLAPPPLFMLNIENQVRRDLGRALDHFTQQPVGVGADEDPEVERWIAQRPQARATANCSVSADSGRDDPLDFSQLSAELSLSELIRQCKEVEVLADRRSAAAPPGSTERAFQSGIVFLARRIWLSLSGSERGDEDA